MKSTLRMKSLIAALALTVVVSLLITPSFSFATAWTAAGSTGTVDESYVDNFQTYLSYINFKPGMAGSVQARYNVTNTADTDQHYMWNAFYISYFDSSNDSRIRAYLRYVELETGITHTIASFDSADYSKSYSTQLQRVLFDHCFDFTSNAYHVEVYMTRTSSSVSTPKVYGLQLDTYLY